MSGTGNFIGGLVIGTTVGLLTGLLIAPSSGTQTRKKIVNKSKVYSQQAIDAVRQYLENMKQGKTKTDLAVGNHDEFLNSLKDRSNIGYEGI